MKKLVLTVTILSTSVITSGCGIYSYYSSKQNYENAMLVDAKAKAKEKAEKQSRNEFLAKNCQTTMPNSRFKDNQNGTVTDIKTGLMWKQCVEGQIGSECKDSDGTKGSYTSKSAMEHIKLINNVSFAGYRDWRMPKIEELKTIFDASCYPYINKNIFPNSLFTGVLGGHSMPFMSSSYDGSSNSIWVMDFDSELGNTLWSPEGYSVLRLVRSQQ